MSMDGKLPCHMSKPAIEHCGGMRGIFEKRRFMNVLFYMCLLLMSTRYLISCEEEDGRARTNLVVRGGGGQYVTTMNSYLHKQTPQNSILHI